MIRVNHSFLRYNYLHVPQKRRKQTLNSDWDIYWPMKLEERHMSFFGSIATKKGRTFVSK